MVHASGVTVFILRSAASRLVLCGGGEARPRPPVCRPVVSQAPAATEEHPDEHRQPGPSPAMSPARGRSGHTEYLETEDTSHV